MDSCFKRWTMGGKNTLLLLRQQRTISRLDLRQKLGTMGTRWPRCFAGNLEDMACGLFGVLDAFLSSESRSESGLTRSVACHCRCRAVGAGKLLIDTLQRGLSRVDPGSPQLELSALLGEETLQTSTEAAVSRAQFLGSDISTSSLHVSTSSLLRWHPTTSMPSSRHMNFSQDIRCNHCVTPRQYIPSGQVDRPILH